MEPKLLIAGTPPTLVNVFPPMVCPDSAMIEVGVMTAVPPESEVLTTTVPRSFKPTKFGLIPKVPVTVCPPIMVVPRVISA